MPPPVRPLIGAAAAALVATIVPAFAAAPAPDAPAAAGCTERGVDATFAIQPDDATRLGHVLLSGLGPGCLGRIVTVEIGDVRRHAVVDGPEVRVHVDGAVPLAAVTSLAVSVRPPEETMR